MIYIYMYNPQKYKYRYVVAFSLEPSIWYDVECIICCEPYIKHIVMYTRIAFPSEP